MPVKPVDKEPRTAPRASYKAGPYTLDGRSGEVKDGLRPVALTQIEFEVLYQLVDRGGETVLRREFGPWFREALPGDRHPVDMVVYKLRKLLESSLIEHVWGRGYRLSPGVPVETITSPTLSERERLAIIALDHTNMHSGRSFRASIKNCEATLRKGPNADAYVTLAMSLINLSHTGFCMEPPGVALPKAKRIINEGLKHFPNLAAGYAWRGVIHLVSDYAWADAEADFKKALELDPRDECGHLFLAIWQVAQGFFEKGLDHVRIAADVGFQYGMTVVSEPWLMLFAGHLEDALRTGEQVAERFSDMAPVHDILGHIYSALDAHQKAIAEYTAALEIDFSPDPLASLGYVYGKAGDHDGAYNCLRLLREAEKTGKLAYVSAHHEALIFAGLNDHERCLAALERAYDQRCDWLIFLNVEPRWSNMRNEKRFVRIVEQVGLQERAKVDSDSEKTS